MFKLEPDEAEDYPAQDDRVIARSPNAALWQAAHQRSFFSGRFSRLDETFCYVKIDGSEGLDEAGFADKSEIEDAMDAVLAPERLGRSIGGGTGLRYSYIDVAVTHPERALARVAERLRQGRVPKRSWIQFFDADLCGEWIGMYPDTPAPPGY
jgi:hypothetical protein